MIDLNKLHSDLSTSIVSVVFTKKNGDTRTIRCTKNFEMIPPEKYPKQESLPTVQGTNPDVERVFDLDINEWRSFRKDSITKIL